MSDDPSLKPSMPALRVALRATGVTGAALALTATAALPALACHGRPNGGNGGSTSSTGSRGSEHGHADARGHATPHSHPTTHDRASAHGHTATHSRATTHSHPTASGHQAHGKASAASHAHPASQAGTAGHNPPGNNGTVFIHQVAGDAHPHNQPHVACSFYVALFDFDSNQPLTLSLTGQAPTGAGTPVTVNGQQSLTETAPDNGATGAGHGYDGDFGSMGFTASNLDLSALGAPAKQGYHLRLTIGTGQGGGSKTKVFWFAPCTGQSSTPTAANSSSTSGSQNNGTTAGTAEATRATHRAGSSKPATAGTTRVLGEHWSRTATHTGGTLGTGVRAAAATRPGTVTGRTEASSAAALPFTGADVAAMVAAGVIAIGGGGGLLLLGRRRRRSLGTA